MSSDEEEFEVAEQFFGGRKVYVAYNYPNKGFNTFFDSVEDIDDEKRATMPGYENPMSNFRMNILEDSGFLGDDKEKSKVSKTWTDDPDLKEKMNKVWDDELKKKDKEEEEEEEDEGDWMDTANDETLDKLLKEQKNAEKEGVSEINVNKCLDGNSAQEVLRCLRKKRLAQKMLKDKANKPPPKASKPPPKSRELTTAEINERFKKITPESQKAYKEQMDKLRKEADDILKKKKKATVNDSNKNITLSTEPKKELSKQVAPPRKSKGERVRSVRDDKGGHHKWADGRTKRKTYKLNKKNDVDWSRVRCREDTCWKTDTRKTDATTKNKKSGDKKVYEYNVDNDHYKGQLRRKKGKRKNN